MTITPEVLCRRWVHSHEEDTDTEMVFRPASFHFPPSRGRTSFDLRPDGTLLESAPGPVDVAEEAEGTWEFEGDDLVLNRPGGRQVLRVAHADPDRLVVRK